MVAFGESANGAVSRRATPMFGASAMIAIFGETIVLPVDASDEAIIASVFAPPSYTLPISGSTADIVIGVAGPSSIPLPIPAFVPEVVVAPVGR